MNIWLGITGVVAATAGGREGLTHVPGARFGVVMMMAVVISCGQQPTTEDLTNLDMAVAHIKDKGAESFTVAHKQQTGITPYDHGRRLLSLGKADEAKKWYSQLGIATEDPQYLYGLATVRWRTGQNGKALNDCRYLLEERNAGDKLRARTLYLMGCILIDERDFEKAESVLDEAFETYGSIPNMFGGQYLALSMQAWAAIASGNHDDVEPLLDRAMEFNEKLRTVGLEPYGSGRYHETLAELAFVKGDYQRALAKAKESQDAYFQSGRLLESDMMGSKVALYLLLTGKPKAADALAAQMWEKFNDKPDKARAAAYNEITLAKLDQCSGNDADKERRLAAARSWAVSATGGKALIELLNFIMDREKVPCPEWED